jgi:hypothetical protein
MLKPAQVVLCITITTILSALSFSQAQEAKPLPRHPGNVIKYQIKFDGPNADKVKRVNAVLELRVAVKKDQAGFDPQFSSKPEWIDPSPSGTFLVEMTVPPRAATGEYHLRITAQLDHTNLGYTDGQDFNITVNVVNPATFDAPTITVNPLP